MTVTKKEMVDEIVEASFPADWAYNRKEKREMRKQKMRVPKSKLEDAHDYAVPILEERRGE